MKTYFSLDFIPQGDYPASSHETFEHVFDNLGSGSIDFWAQGCSRDVIERGYGKITFSIFS